MDLSDLAELMQQQMHSEHNAQLSPEQLLEMTELVRKGTLFLSLSVLLLSSCVSTCFGYYLYGSALNQFSLN